MNKHKQKSAKPRQSTNVEPYENARRLSVLRRRRHVVIVDDESTGRTILEMLVRKIDSDLQVTGFSSASKALEWLKTNPADMIITDYRMPEINGVEFIRRVRGMSDFESVPIMMITVVSEKSVRYEALDAGATAFLTRPIDQIECSTSCRNLLKMQEQQSIIRDKADWLARQVDVATQQIVSRERETLLRLGLAGEYRDSDTGNHVLRMAKYSRAIAEELGIAKIECDDIEYAAPMHDIGKIGIPDHILLKTGKLTSSEWEIMKQHTVFGHNILSNSQSRYIQLGSIIALNHHEKFDGSGYPSGLQGQEIPLEARIVAVADVFDALVTKRPYKKAWTDEQALNMLELESGNHFDPECVNAFFNRLDDIFQIRAELTD
ncbi:HD domain-containing phosphohydrolase [Solemya velum gill symbiont]|uniref:Response regulator n=1 Tax=Solemya velum gill symbiont TaxID=2340 RepID=A0A0B0H790_SOVGS|nr:HD domain-containing phosphohydrolase [Solemya velum gill symbiont]KHF24522.1 response regulator [Solemya velum gill symbiont]OOY97103.1 two-component system response regulator [Solemya velum gill symbiont]OOY99080.1 two-component system response regulator [Solemya velum gill symbiont]OOZ01517.1 two-component system response regulator [Solemya velum gill symbiont]OOZ03563.1 two-component system response regulator [Solemya velum gill symbiont]